jgi:hypothetical protein
LISNNAGNPAFDIDGDFDADRADRDLLIYDILETRPGDANLDRHVDFVDLLVLAQSFGQPGGWAQADFDGNATVNFADLLTLSQNYSPGGGLSAHESFLQDARRAGGGFLAALLPEPTAILVGSVVGLFAVGRPIRSIRP